MRLNQIKLSDMVTVIEEVREAQQEHHLTHGCIGNKFINQTPYRLHVELGPNGEYTGLEIDLYFPPLCRSYDTPIDLEIIDS